MAAWLRRFGGLVGVLMITAPVWGVDTDGDGVDDLVDVCCNTPAGAAVDAQGRPIGDFDGDCDNDLADFSIYLTGFTGPLAGPVSCPGCTQDSDCDDGVFCTLDSCNLSTGVCTNAPQTGLACDDGNGCTVGDTCSSAGACVGGAGVDCSGLDGVCVEGVCNPQTGQCEIQPVDDGIACDDGQYCSLSDVCIAGACTGVPRDCSNFADQCNAGVCDEQQSACVQSPLPAGTTCDDGNPNTVADMCDGLGNCVGVIP